MKTAFGVFHCFLRRWGVMLLPLWGIGCAAHPGLLQAQLQTSALECDGLLVQAEARRTLQILKIQLQAQGMRLRVQACPRVHMSSGRQQQVLAVQVQVTDSETASRFVRGPLGDGEMVDMGLGWEKEPVVDEEVSPDVHFNRAWLITTMQKGGWQSVAGRWWGFVPARQRGTAK